MVFSLSHLKKIRFYHLYHFPQIFVITKLLFKLNHTLAHRYWTPTEVLSNIQKDVLLLFVSRDDVIQSARKMNPHFPGHGIPLP